MPLADKELLAFPLLNRLDLRRVGPLEFLLGDDMIFISISGAFKEKLRFNFIETLEKHSVNAVDEMWVQPQGMMGGNGSQFRTTNQYTQ